MSFISGLGNAGNGPSLQILNIYTGQCNIEQLYGCLCHVITNMHKYFTEYACNVAPTSLSAASYTSDAEDMLMTYNRETEKQMILSHQTFLYVIHANHKTYKNWDFHSALRFNCYQCNSFNLVRKRYYPW